MSPRARVALTLALVALALAAGGYLRKRLLADFHAAAGDGKEYHALAHELALHHRYAYLPEPVALSWSRVPGYPVLLSWLEKTDTYDISPVIVRGTKLNVLFDLATALLLFLIARAVKLGRAEPWIALVLALVSPLGLLQCCYLLRESLTTMLWTGAVLLLLLARDRRKIAPLAAAGAVTGLAMLVRFDAITLAPAFLVPWLAATRGSRQRRALGAVCAAAACAAVFSPWPIRNQLRFGDPHAAGAAWVDDHGNPLPTGERAWLRTWITNMEQGYLNLRFVHHGRIKETELLPASWDDEDEHQRLRGVVQVYNSQGLSTAVDAEFRAMARDRIRRHPLRVLVWLPLRRAALWWWSPPPPWEQPLKSLTFKLPERRWVLEWASHAIALLALAGMVALIERRDRRQLAALLALGILPRTFAFAWQNPDGGYQRFLAPVYPLALLLCAHTLAIAGRGIAAGSRALYRVARRFRAGR